MSSHTPSSVAVVGAGIAGLTCANELRTAGLEVRLFEKSRGPGGRLCTRRIAGLRFDHGTPGFEATTPEFLEQVHTWQQAGVVERDPVQRVRWRDGNWEEQAGPRPWLAVPRMSALGRHLAQDLDVNLETRVAAVSRQDRQWLLRVSTGTELGSFDFVVFACPAPQAAVLLPADSPLRAVAQGVRFAPAWVAMWHGDAKHQLEHDHIEFQDEVLARAFREGARPRRATGGGWVLHAGVDWTRDHLEETQETVGDLLARRFERLTGLPPARDVWAHRWRYSEISSPAQGQTVDLERGLALVGDGTRGRGVEAAWISGRELANTLLGRRETAVSA